MIKNIIKHLSLMIFLLATLAFWYHEASAQTFLPVGPQTNVPVDTVTGGGWTECYRDTYNIVLDVDADTVLSQCPGDRLMLSCRTTGSDTLTLLAQGLRSDVTFDSGINTDVLHVANGVGWYFANVYSWGFVRAGDSVFKTQCDTDTTGANDERLCWHLTGSSGGYRCGETQGLNDSVDFERIVYVASDLPPPPPPVSTTIPTLSEWGLIAMAGLMGIVGFIVMRRRKAVA